MRGAGRVPLHAELRQRHARVQAEARPRGRRRVPGAAGRAGAPCHGRICHRRQGEARADGAGAAGAAGGEGLLPDPVQRDGRVPAAVRRAGVPRIGADRPRVQHDQRRVLREGRAQLRAGGGERRGPDARAADLPRGHLPGRQGHDHLLEAAAAARRVGGGDGRGDGRGGDGGRLRGRGLQVHDVSAQRRVQGGDEDDAARRELEGGRRAAGEGRVGRPAGDHDAGQRQGREDGVLLHQLCDPGPSAHEVLQPGQGTF